LVDFSNDLLNDLHTSLFRSAYEVSRGLNGVRKNMGIENKIRNVCAVAAWLLTLALVFATLCPIDLRPQSGFPAGWERFGAFALTGLLFGSAYPHYYLRTAFSMAVFIAALEFAQNFTHTRHGAVLDFVVKAFGAAIGVGAAIGLLGWLEQKGSKYSTRTALGEPNRAPSQSSAP
jgi:hypothetical protein